MSSTFSTPTRHEIKDSQQRIRAGWDPEERCLRRLVAVLKQQQLAQQLDALQRKAPASRAG